MVWYGGDPLEESEVMARSVSASAKIISLAALSVLFHLHFSVIIGENGGR